MADWFHYTDCTMMYSRNC